MAEKWGAYGSRWSRPGGLREVLRLASPMMVTTGAWAVMLFMDRLFLFRSSIHEFNAALPAGTLYWLVMSLFVGIASYTNTFVAQYYGAGNRERIGASVWQGIRLGIYATPFFLLLIPFASWYFRSTTSDPATALAESRYFQILVFGCTASIVSAAQGALFNGRGKTRVVMLVNIGAVLLNIVLDYVLILGKLGFPPLGIVGAGIATTLASWAMVVAFAVLMRRRENWEGFHIRSAWRHDSELLGRMFRFGTPNGLPMLVEAVTFHVLVKLVLTLGTVKAAASSLVLSINQLAHFPLVGLGIACSILVGQRVTSGRQDEARTAIGSALFLGLSYCLFFIILYLVLPDPVMRLHREMMPYDGAFWSIREVAVVLLRFAGLYLVLECVQLVFSGAIKGAGDTWFVLKTTIAASLVTVVGYFLAKPLGLYALWTVYILQITLIGVACLWRFRGGRWKAMNVLEKSASVG